VFGVNENPEINTSAFELIDWGILEIYGKAFPMHQDICCHLPFFM
jgi:hypothetical protein